jgi:hypothetical protein
MAKYSRQKVNSLFRESDGATDNNVKGRALEDLICYLIETVPGVSVTTRNTLNSFASEEIDIAFWNEQKRNGFSFLPRILLTECKNWSSAVGSSEVSFFAQKLKHRGLDHGILIASNGITGSPEDLRSAHHQITMALSERLHILVVTREEIQKLAATEDLVMLFKKKLTQLAVAGTIF